MLIVFIEQRETKELLLLFKTSILYVINMSTWLIETRRKKVGVHVNSMLLTMPVLIRVSHPNLLYNVDGGNRQIKVRSLWFVVQLSLIFEEPWVIALYLL